MRTIAYRSDGAETMEFASRARAEHAVAGMNRTAEAAGASCRWQLEPPPATEPETQKGGA